VSIETKTNLDIEAAPSFISIFPCIPMPTLTPPPLNANLATTRLEFDRASQGIKRPEVQLLAAGEAIFRFASSRNQQTGQSIPSTEWAKGAWWVRESEYRKIIARHQSGRLPLGTVARAAVAVQPSWSNMDVSIKATVVKDIYVYVGQGSTQYRDQMPNGMFVTLKGWPDVQQIYIPGMRSTSFTAIRVLRQKIVTTNDFGF
ncbi:MAG: hypothetical protein KDA84_07350, partial [Planctomycetaceae bacterium]|nr:hypothetical protein [Planctomycetaceae bacterium]